MFADELERAAQRIETLERSWNHKISRMREFTADEDRQDWALERIAAEDDE